MSNLLSKAHLYGNLSEFAYAAVPIMLDTKLGIKPYPFTFHYNDAVFSYVQPSNMTMVWRMSGAVNITIKADPLPLTNVLSSSSHQVKVI